MSSPSVLIVMGVSGSGKSTVAAVLAGRLGWELMDADDFHSPANVAKMHGGTPLTDADRAPWLASIAAWAEAVRSTGGHGVVSCSALRRSYRDVLTGGHPEIRVVYLKGDPAVIAARQERRTHHFMPASLLDSQFATLEEPARDENPIMVSVNGTPGAAADAVVAQLRAPHPA